MGEVVAESWEREELSLTDLLKMNNHKVLSYRRPKVKNNRQPGGSCAIIYSENRFTVSGLEVNVPKGVEVVWSLFRPKSSLSSIQSIIIASIYVSPTSKHKSATIEHIIENIQLFRSKYKDVKFLLGGDLNNLKI